MATSTITTAVPTTTTADPTTTAAPTTTTVAPTTTTAAPTTTTIAPTTTVLATSTITTSTSTTTAAPTTTLSPTTTTIFPSSVGATFPGIPNSAISASEFSPYRHWVVENVIPPVLASFLYDSIPSSLWSGWSNSQNDFEKKKISSNITGLGTPIQSIFNMLLSTSFSSILSGMTGIPGLVADRTLYGCGVSVYENGDYVTPNLQYEINPISGMEKRVGLMIFLAPSWNVTNGGMTVLWDDSVNNPLVSIMPLHTRMFIYKNDGASWLSNTKVSGMTQRLITLSASYMTEPRETARIKRTLFIPNTSYETT